MHQQHKKTFTGGQCAKKGCQNRENLYQKSDSFKSRFCFAKAVVIHYNIDTYIIIYVFIYINIQYILNITNFLLWFC